MPSTVADVFAAGGLRPAGVVRWGTPLPERAPGVYVVALSEDPASLAGCRATAPLDEAKLAGLLSLRPELRLDGRAPSPSELVERLAAFWLQDEVIVYLGLAGTSLRTRVGQYYKTPLGARKPHAGGWWLKTLTVLEGLWVHYAATPESASVEVAMLQRFADALSPASRAGLYDPDDPAPFANLRTGRSSIKQHGIKGATGELGPGATINVPAAPTPSQTSPPASAPAVPPLAMSQARGIGNAPSQTVTAKDILAGQVRFPRPARRLLPPERSYVAVTLRGRHFERVRWDPRIGADKERSGLLGFGKGKLDGLVGAGEKLTLTSYADGRLEMS